MITFEYFSTYLVLILHISESLCAEQSNQNVTVFHPKTIQNATKDVILTPNATSIPNNLNVPLEFPKAKINGTNIMDISINSTHANLNSNITYKRDNKTIPESDMQINQTSNVPSEFPQEATNGTTIISTYFNGTGHVANMRSNITLDISDLNKTENLTSTGHISNVPSEFPETSINGAEVLLFNNSLVTANLSTPEVEGNYLNTTEIKVTNSSNKIDTEVPDLLNIHREPCNASQILVLPPQMTFNTGQTINRETELIEDGQNTEDILRNSSLIQKSSHSPGVPLVEGQLAAILAAIFVAISVVTYIGLLSWRRLLENRYGNRELLVNEDEFNDRDDLRHFTGVKRNFIDSWTSRNRFSGREKRKNGDNSSLDQEYEFESFLRCYSSKEGLSSFMHVEDFDEDTEMYNISKFGPISP